jgi:hypothetical protein
MINKFYALHTTNSSIVRIRSTTARLIWGLCGGNKLVREPNCTKWQVWCRCINQANNVSLAVMGYENFIFVYICNQAFLYSILCFLFSTLHVVRYISHRWDCIKSIAWTPRLSRNSSQFSCTTCWICYLYLLAKSIVFSLHHFEAIVFTLHSYVFSVSTYIMN